MPHETQLTEKGAYSRFYGTVLFDEVLLAQGEIWNREDWEQVEYQIVDFLGVEELQVAEHHIKAVALMDNVATKRLSGWKIALVASNPDILELCKLYASILAEAKVAVEIFQDLKDATTWAKS